MFRSLELLYATGKRDFHRHTHERLCGEKREERTGEVGIEGKVCLVLSLSFTAFPVTQLTLHTITHASNENLCDSPCIAGRAVQRLVCVAMHMIALCYT